MDTSKPTLVVVTGGAGFIGSHVVRALRQKNIPVRVFDSLIAGSRQNVPDDVQLVIGDVRDRNALDGALKDASHVIHLAALVSVPESMRNPESTYDVNVVGTKNVFEVSEDAKVKRVVYASSASIYGNNPALPKHEGMKPQPESPYATSKVQNESDAYAFTKRTGKPSIGLRFFNIYGPGQAGSHPYASVIPRWIDALKGGEEIHVFGDGKQTRDFIDVRDIAEAVVLALLADTDGAKIYNVASGTQVSLLELRDLLSHITGKPVVWVEHPEREGDIRHSVADVSAIKQELGFLPQKSLEEGIKELFA